jgi:bacterioferritin (cytochrome b1)
MSKRKEENKVDEELFRALNLNMNQELRATFQYICHRIAAKDSNALLAESFKTAALDEMTHILYFSDLITKYGGKPQFTEWEIDKSSDVKTMLESDLKLEQEARIRYSEQLDNFKDFSDVMTVLEDVLDDENSHEETFQRYVESKS